MANPFSNDVTVILFQWEFFRADFSVGVFQFFDTPNLFIIILNSKTFLKYTDIFFNTTRNVTA